MPWNVNSRRDIECLDCGERASIAAVDGLVPLGQRCAACTDRYAEQLVRLRWFLAQAR